VGYAGLRLRDAHGASRLTLAVTTSAPGFLAFCSERLAGSGIVLRPALEADAAFIAAVYATTRAEELAAVDWTPENRKTFTDWQSRQQEGHYALHYPGAERLVIERGEPIGRIYVDSAGSEVRLMEVTLLPASRNQGIGTRLLLELLAYADLLGKPASLHVEPFNPAKRMYERAGFAVVEARGLYEFMMRPAPS
jgi:ribosomal protein S18 acetylase RimI-like enzyme